MPRSRDNTAKLAKELWTAESLDLTPAEFQSRFDAIYAVAEGPATLWRLGGAANDYLYLNPGSIHIPEELVETLVDSPIVDGRIIGLKLLARYSPDIPAITTAICRALECQHEGELYGGLYEFNSLIDRLDSPSELPKKELLVSLRKLYSSSDPYVRETAARHVSWLEEFCDG